MWVHADHVEEDGQWTTVSHKKSEDKGKATPYHMVYASAVESDSDVSSLFITDIEKIPPIGVRMPLATRTSLQKKLEDAGGVPSSSRASPPE